LAGVRLSRCAGQGVVLEKAKHSPRTAAPNQAVVAPREARPLGMGRQPRTWVVVTQGVRAEMAHVPSDERRASRAGVTSTCTPRHGRTEREGTRRPGA